ncbi:phage antirepressor KilAC domain-containing protein [Lactobacillus delbrueckii]|uniref:phage antirepressor n=1 Tax=Lactobacillus delbrueckii TaxID=1584 RepID=UPI0023E36452|nr:phage antirepressor KilAC domain-containing protein [Lactobacillus delbrueckii]MDF4030098.1 phage antirepressor KilAC domain-containing protein [Lactobacillus delbrueckii]
MTNEIMNFEFDGNDVRTMQINEEAWFVGKDVASVLGYSNPRDALAKHVDDEDKQILTSRNTTLENIPNRGLQVINESGLYSLILSSKLPAAKKFKRWVTSEVLPAIRQHGAYMTDAKAEAIVTDKSALADLLQQAADQLKEKDILIEELKPKALFADSVAASKSTVLVGELAKILRGNGVDIGANRLFAWMRENGYLISRKGSDWNMPTQRAMDMGLFKIKETTINHSNGVTTVSKTPKVTGKGQQYFITKFLKKSA